MHVWIVLLARFPYSVLIKSTNPYFSYFLTKGRFGLVSLIEEEEEEGLGLLHPIKIGMSSSPGTSWKYFVISSLYYTTISFLILIDSIVKG